MDITDRINLRLKTLGIKRADLSNKAGINKSSISQWYSGRNKPSGKNLLTLAEFLRCEPNWLLTGKGNVPTDFVDENVLDSTERVVGHYPLISWVQAGTWTEAVEFPPGEFEYYPCPKKCSDKTFLLKVTGDSMEPRFHEGDLIYIDPMEDAIHKKFVVAKLTDDNTTTFKQLIIEDGKKFLKALNPNWHTQYVPINGNCEIIGVVIYVGREV